MDEDEFRASLEDAHGRLSRLLEHSRAGRFTVGDQPNSRQPANLRKHVARIEAALDEIDRALQALSEQSYADRT